MSIGVVTVAHGEKYRAFLPEWAEAVSRLETQPDAVTIVTDTLDCEHLAAACDLLSPDAAVIETRSSWTNHAQVLVNEAIAFTRTDWICKMDVDDLIMPHALNDLPHDADVFMFGILLDGRNLYPQNISRQHVLDAPFNLVFSGSPFRRWVWSESPFRDMIYEDWMFWIDAAKNGARFTPSRTVDYEYRIHGSNVSLSCDEAYWASVVRALS